MRPIEDPRTWSIRGRLSEMLCVNNILIMMDLSFFDKLLCCTAAMSWNRFFIFIESDVL